MNYLAAVMDSSHRGALVAMAEAVELMALEAVEAKEGMEELAL